MKRILVVDDSEFVRQHVRRTLEVGHYVVFEAADGNLALDVLRASSDIDLVVCDVNMPNCSGIELLEQLPQLAHVPPVIMLTSEADVDLIRQAKALGAKGWIVKPFKPDMLLRTVDKLMGIVGAP